MTLFVLHGWCAPYAPAWMLFPLFSFQAAPSRPVHGWLFNASVFILIAADVHLWVSPTCSSGTRILPWIVALAHSDSPAQHCMSAEQHMALTSGIFNYKLAQSTHGACASCGMAYRLS